jgi:hypothetical protein
MQGSLKSIEYLRGTKEYKLTFIAQDKSFEQITIFSRMQFAVLKAAINAVKEPDIKLPSHIQMLLDLKKQEA